MYSIIKQSSFGDIIIYRSDVTGNVLIMHRDYFFLVDMSILPELVSTLQSCIVPESKK